MDWSIEAERLFTSQPENTKVKLKAYCEDIAKTRASDVESTPWVTEEIVQYAVERLDDFN